MERSKHILLNSLISKLNIILQFNHLSGNFRVSVKMILLTIEHIIGNFESRFVTNLEQYCLMCYEGLEMRLLFSVGTCMMFANC